MKKKLLLFPMGLVLAYFLLSSYTNAPAGSHSIDGTGATNASGCGGTGCHAAATGTDLEGGIVVFDSTGAAQTQYIPGKGYFLAIAAFNGSFSTLPVFGFQLTVVKISGARTTSAVMAGSLATSGLPTYIANDSYHSLNFYEQTDTLASDTSITYGAFHIMGYKEVLPWTAPASGTGTVIVFGAICSAIGNGSASGYWANWADTLGEMPPPAPITGTTTVCIGSTSTLSDTSHGGTWSSASPSVATVSGSGVVTGVTAGTAVISYTTAAGSSTTTVTVSSATAGVISGPTTACAGGHPITLTESVTGGTWSSSNMAVATVSSGLVYPVGPGTTVISYSVTTACGALVATYNITVASGVSTGAISGSATVCSGLTTWLTESVSGGVWSSGSTSIATVNSSGVVTGVAAGSATISYAVTNGCGTAYATQSITVNASPSPGVISGVPALFCTQNTAAMSETVAGGVWSSGNTAIATVDASGNLTGVAGGSVTISYTVTGAGGCYAVATDPVSVTQGPPSSITASGATSFCYGDVVLNANTGAGFSWQWYDGTTIIPGATSSSYTATSTGGYIVYVHNNTGCSTPSAATDVTLLSVPAIYTGGATTFCSGKNVLLSVSAVGGGYTSIYQWKLNTVNIPGATNTSYSATMPGSYTCFENISGGCTGLTPAVAVTVDPTPSPVITFNGTDLMTSSTYATYQWQVNGVNIPGATTDMLAPTVDGNYTVLVTNATGGCAGISMPYPITPLSSVKNIVANNDYKIFPNPAGNVINVNNTSGNNSSATYVITDVPGRTILSGSLTGNVQQIDISQLAPGNYILKITGDTGNSVQMFVKQ